MQAVGRGRHAGVGKAHRARDRGRALVECTRVLLWLTVGGHGRVCRVRMGAWLRNTPGPADRTTSAFHTLGSQYLDSMP